MADIHVESTAEGARLAAERGDIVVIVDVLSFSTTIGIAVDRGAEALVYSGEEIDQRGGREAIARDLDAEIIAKGRIPDGERFSLSPASLGALEPGDRVIFTSWNGAACVSAAMDRGRSAGTEALPTRIRPPVSAPAVLIAALNNRTAAANAVVELLGESDPAADPRRRCTIVAAAEHWSSTVPGRPGIRPALEDQLGAGAIAARLGERGLELSVEAHGRRCIRSGGKPHRRCPARA
ncbi:MAG: 2-phosphosulfolactate phosphatase [Acidimicrobiales bacterium]